MHNGRKTGMSPRHLKKDDTGHGKEADRKEHLGARSARPEGQGEVGARAHDLLDALAGPIAAARGGGSAKALEKHAARNKLFVRAKGPRAQIWLNGYQTVDFTETEENIPLKGRFGLQIHSGPPAECWYRNLRLKKL